MRNSDFLFPRNIAIKSKVLEIARLNPIELANHVRLLDLVNNPSEHEMMLRARIQFRPMARHPRVINNYFVEMIMFRLFPSNKPYPFGEDDAEWLTGDMVAALAVAHNVVDYSYINEAALHILNEQINVGWDEIAVLSRLYVHPTFLRFVRKAREYLPEFYYEMTPQESGKDVVDNAYQRAQLEKDPGNHIALMNLWMKLKTDFDNKWGI
jgi:hypothetical protein